MKINVTNNLIEKFWFVPHDALLRGLDYLAIAKTNIESPSLDIGCGNGQMSLFMYPDRKIDVGVDLDPSGAEKVGVYKMVKAADATKLLFKSNSFQTVISNSTFEHIPEDKKAVSEVARVLKKNGTFILTATSPYLESSVRELMSSVQELKLFNQRMEHFHYRSEEEWTKIFEQNNLRVIVKKQYFSQSAIKTWYRLFKIATWKPYKRELWSYLQDSFFGTLIPKGLVVWFFKQYFEQYSTNIWAKEGGMHLIIGQKQ